MKTETKRVGYLEFKRDQEKIMNYTGELEQAFAALGITMEDIESLSFGVEVLKKARPVAGKDC